MHGGQFLWIGFDGDELSPALAARLRALKAYGWILFTRNITGAARLQKLCADLRDLDPEGLLAIDLEGGPVDRLRAMRGAPRPSAAELAAGGLAEIRAAGAAIGAELRGFGIAVDYAPCVDLGPAERGTGLESRLFCEKAEAVSARAGEFLSGLQGAGVAGCLKHYPGLGGSRVDSHFALPEISGDALARSAHLQPYRELGAGCPFVMVAHAVYSALYRDPRPASLNPEAYAALRDDLQFAGAALSDDLHMKALAAFGAITELAVASIRAGADAALICQDLDSSEAAAQALTEALRDKDFAARAEAAAARLQTARLRVREIAAHG